MKKYESQRGAILVESALIVGAIFLMLFGTVFIAIIGFDQMSADGASFEVAHQTSVGAAAPAGAAHSAFPNIPQTQIATVPLPAPTPTIPVDYGYNSTSAPEQRGSVNDRHGGVSMMQASQIQGQVSKTSASLLGMPMTVMSTMIEPLWLENGLHFNAQNSDAYGGTTPVCAPTPAGGGATPPPCFQGNVLTQGENAPPYFTGFSLMQHCQENLPWGTLPGQTCAAGSQFTPLGVSEFLDISNWCATGTTSPCTPVTNPGVAGTVQTDATGNTIAADSTFAAMSCHQRVYAAIALFFKSNPNLEQIYKNQGGFTLPGWSAAPSYYFRDARVASNPTNSFAYWAGFDVLPPNANLTPAQQVAAKVVAEENNSLDPNSVDAAIRKVYAWDGADISGPPKATPLYPGKGC